jgi:hypothetical protein
LASAVPSPEKPALEGTGLKPTNAYLAGYLDADGCIRFYGGTPRIEIAGVFPWILEEYAMRWGGSVRPMRSSHSRPIWRWSICGDKAERCLLDLMPDLYVKKAQGQLVLQARRIEPGPYRDSVIAQVKALKHRDYHG